MSNTLNNIFKSQLGNKGYELKDHLSNIHLTYNDTKLPILPFNVNYEVDLLSKREYFFLLIKTILGNYKNERIKNTRSNTTRR